MKFKVEQNPQNKNISVDGLNMTILRNSVEEEITLPWEVLQKIYQAVDFQYHKEDIEHRIQEDDELEVDNYSQDDINHLTELYMENMEEGTMDRAEAIDAAFYQYSVEKEDRER